MLILTGLVLLVSAFLASTILSCAVRAVATRLNFVDAPGARKVHARPIPLGGGIAFFVTLTAIVGGGALFALWQADVGPASWLPELLQRHLPGLAKRAPLAFFVLAGGAVMFLLGLIDDLRGLSPWSRILVQALVAVALCAASDKLRITAFVDVRWISYVYTTFWIVGITNAFNLLDNMDGLSAGVAVVASGVFLVLAVLTGQYFLAATLLVFIGALLGFLLFNFPPATLFMGDAGSTFIGYMLGVLTVLFTFYMPELGHNPVSSIVTPLVILAVPIYDTASVVIIRLHARKPVFEGDKNHFSHRLVALGMTPRAAVITIYLVTLCTGLLAPLLLRLSMGMATLVFLNAALMLVLIWLLEHTGRRGQNQRNGQ